MEVPRPDYLGGGAWKLNGLKPITAIFGKNGSGKSKLLRQWRDIAPQTSHYVVPERAGEIDYQANYLLGQLSADTRRNEAQRNFAGEYRRQVVARIQAYFSARGDTRGGPLPTNPEELEQLIAPLLPDFTLTLSGTKAPPYELQRTEDGSSVDSIDQLSSGETQVLTLALDILTIVGIWDIQKTTPRLLLVDEPDAHIHPDLQVRFADFLVSVGERFNLQIVVATHSTTLLAAIGQFARENAGVVYLDRITADLKVEPFSAVLRELSACLGGHALMGPLFGSPLLLVEGDDDYRIWSQVPRYHVVNLSVIPCGGDEIKKYQRSLEKVLAALREPGIGQAGFALIDRDKGKPIADAANPQDHVRFIQLACHESENLYLADEVLGALDTDWPSASAKIASEADKFGQKADILRTAPTWDRKTSDIKKVIEEIATILDPKRVHWTIRVAKAIGVGRPAGQLAEFLGGEVLDAIWGPAGT
jgi:energy-coupling factor transporter ATP-binding protein EcfA2